MNKGNHFIVICMFIGMLPGLCLFDTAQAMLFNNSPIVKVREDYNGGKLYCLDKGLLADSYLYTNGKRVTVFKWEQPPSNDITFPAYEEDNAENKPYLVKVNHTPQFQVHADFPDGWTVREPIADDEITVPGEFYTTLILCEQDQPIGYIGFNLFEPYDGEIPQEQYYQTVYSALRLPSTFHWDPYTAIKSTDTAETGIADIWYLGENEIDNHPGAMPDVPQFETIGILSYDKELEVYIGIAFLPDTVNRAQAEAIAQSIELSPLK